MRIGTIISLVALLLPLILTAEVKPEDFIIDLNHADRAAELSVLYSPGVLKKVARFYANDPVGRQSLARIKQQVATILNSGDFKNQDNYSDYIFRVSLDEPGMLYFLTGHKGLGKFIHDKVLDIAGRPLEFWLHAERFPMNKDNPVATLQTGAMLSKFTIGIDLAAELFNQSERNQILEAVKNKGLIPCKRFFRADGANNWTAVIAGGAYLAAKLIQDKDSARMIVDVIKKYLAKSIESDGSYGEGQQYLLYPVGVLIPALAAMDLELRNEVIGSSPVAKAGDYLPYSFFFFSYDGSTVRIQFRDGQQIAGVDALALWSIAIACNSGHACAFAERLEIKPPFTNLSFAVLYNSTNTIPKAIPLETMPLVRAFDNGECYIRSDWSDHGILFGMLSGGANKTGFSHDRPARNGIAMGAYGEYLLVCPGHSSYRGDVYLNYDSSTHGNNTVSIDGKNQLFPRNQSPFDNYGIPSAKVLQVKSGNDYDVLISDAADCYVEKPAFAIRAVVFVHSPGYFVVFDWIGGGKGFHQFDSFWHFNNLDGKSKLTKSGKNNWILVRPKATLRVFSRSDSDLMAQEKPGLMHRRYAYSPGGHGEGKPGSAKTLQLSSAPRVSEWKVATLLYPEKFGNAMVPVNVDGNGKKLNIRIGDRHDVIEFSGKEFKIAIDNK